MTSLFQTSETTGEGGLDPHPFWLLVGLLSLWTQARFQMGGAKHTLTDVTRYFWFTIYIIMCVCVCVILWPLRFGLMLVLSLYKDNYLHIFKFASFWLHSFCGYWEGWVPVDRLNYTSWMTVVIPTDRLVGPQSLCNLCFGCKCNAALSSLNASVSINVFSRLITHIGWFVAFWEHQTFHY